MADLLKVTGGVKAQGNLPETWTAPASLFDTVDRNDSSIYGWNAATSTLTLPSSNLADGYLIIGAFEYHDTSNGRFNPQGKFVQTVGSGNFAGGPTGGYNRDTSEDRAYVRTWAIIDNPSASAQIQFQWKADADDATGGTERSELQVIPLYYSNIGIYTSTDHSLYGGTTPNQVTGFTAVTESDTNAIEIASNVVTVKGDNKRYLVLGSQFFEGRGGRTQRWHGLRIDGSKEDAAKAYSYYRNTSNDESGDLFTWLLETATANVTIDQFCYRGDGVAAGQGGADIDGSDPGVGDHTLVVIELNDSAEVFKTQANAASSNLATTGPVDLSITATMDFYDSASWQDRSATEVDAEVDMDALIGANVSVASGNVTTGNRWTAFAEVTIDGVEQTDSFAGDYMRNNQGSQDTFGWSANLLGFVALSQNEGVGVSVTELVGSEGGGGGPITSPANWTGVWGINLDTMEASGGTPANTERDAEVTGQASENVENDAEVHGVHDKLETLFDNFNDNTINTTLWTTYTNGGAGSVTETNQRLEIVSPDSGDQTTGMYANLNYRFEDTYIKLEVVDYTVETDQWFIFGVFNGTAAEDLKLRINENGELEARVGSTTVGTNATWDPVAMRFLRIRETSGTTYWEYSADGINWTTHHSQTTPFDYVDTVSWSEIYVYGNGSQTSSTTAIIDNFNINKVLVERDAEVTGALGANVERDAEVSGIDTANTESDAEVHGQDTANAERDAETTGALGSNVERDAETHGQASANTERDAETHGIDTTTTESDAEVHGIATDNSERDAEVHGQQSDNTERDAETTGALGANVERNAEIYGIDTANTEADAEITGQDTASVARDAEVEGADGANVERDAETHGEATVATERDAETTGIDTTATESDAEVHGADSDTTEADAEVHGQDSATVERSAEVDGEAAVGMENTERDAEVHGIDTTAVERDAEVTGSEDATVERDAEVDGSLGANVSRDAEVHGIDTDSVEANAETTGQETDSVERDAEVDGQLGGNVNRDAEIHGIDTFETERSAEVTGSIDDSTERNAEISGISTDSSERDAEVTGVESASTEADAEVTGEQTDGVSRNAEVDGVEPSTVDVQAEVWGAGTNPYCPTDSPLTDKTSPFTDKDTPYSEKTSPYSPKDTPLTDFPKRDCT